MAGAVEQLTLPGLAAWADKTGRNLSQIDFTKPLKVCKVLIVASVKENFAGSHDPDGRPWPKLKRPRANSKGADQPLRDKGLLMAAASAAGNGYEEQLTESFIEYSVNLNYAAIHNYGGSISLPERTGHLWVFPGPDGNLIFTRKLKACTINIPQRQFLGIGAELEEKIILVFGDFIEGLL